MNRPKLYRHRHPDERLTHTVAFGLTGPDAEKLDFIAGLKGEKRPETLRMLIREAHSRLTTETLTRETYSQLADGRR